MNQTSTPAYSHRQSAPLCWTVYGTGILMIVIAMVLDGEPFTQTMLISVALLMAVLGAAFHHLDTVDRGDRLAVRFGPLPLFRRHVPYDRIVSIETGRTTLLEGWGIHFSPRGGMVWNLWGFDCVVVRMQKGVLRIGTDDPQGLAAFLESRIGAHHAAPS